MTRWTEYLALPLAAALLSGCSDEAPAGLAEGALQVATATTGQDPDDDGYLVLVNGSSGGAVGATDALTITGLAAGDVEVELAGVAGNCAIVGSNPRAVTVSAGATASVAFAVACEPAVAMAMVSGDDQRGRAGHELGEPLVVRVTDSGGVGIPNVVVTWSVTSGDGALDGRWQACPPPYEYDSGDPVPVVSAITDAGGFARITFMPTWFGPVTVTARSHGIPGSPVTFTTDATDPGARIEIVGGAEQDGAFGAWEQANGLTVRVTDGEGRGVAHVPVTWVRTPLNGILRRSGCFGSLGGRAITRTRESLEPAGSGYTGLVFVPKSLGASTVSASLPGVDGIPVVFTVNTATVVVGLAVDPWLGGPGFVGPGFSPDVTVPAGVAVEFLNANAAARIKSTSMPAGGASFDSGSMGPDARFRFVPDAPGRWEFVDEISGKTGTVTVTADAGG
jgi:hypothetical protein